MTSYTRRPYGRPTGGLTSGDGAPGLLGWMDRAACKDHPMINGVSIFFPINQMPLDPHEDLKKRDKAKYYAARQVCNSCPVIAECKAEYNKEPIPRLGMYFGKTPRERENLLRARNRKKVTK